MTLSDRAETPSPETMVLAHAVPLDRRGVGVPTRQVRLSQQSLPAEWAFRRPLMLVSVSHHSAPAPRPDGGLPMGPPPEVRLWSNPKGVIPDHPIAHLPLYVPNAQDVPIHTGAFC